jgi:membrane protein implicated in regulation of membrane protease activity
MYVGISIIGFIMLMVSVLLLMNVLPPSPQLIGGMFLAVSIALLLTIGHTFVRR